MSNNGLADDLAAGSWLPFILAPPVCIALEEWAVAPALAPRSTIATSAFSNVVAAVADSSGALVPLDIRSAAAVGGAAVAVADATGDGPATIWLRWATAPPWVAVGGPASTASGEGACVCASSVDAASAPSPATISGSTTALAAATVGVVAAASLGGTEAAAASEGLPPQPSLAAAPVKATCSGPEGRIRLAAGSSSVVGALPPPEMSAAGATAHPMQRE